MLDEARIEKGIEVQGWTVFRIAGLVALAVCVPLLLASAGRSQGGSGEGAAPVAQIPPSATPTVFIPGMPNPCQCSPTPGEAATSQPPPTEVTTPQPTADTRPADPVFGLAWFHKPPGDGTSASTIAKEDRYIHLTGPSDIPFRDAVRAAGFKEPIYTYLAAYEVEGPGPYKNASADCDTNYKPYDNNVAWDRGDFCKYIHPNEAWFLHNGAGDRLVEDYFGTGRYAYMMNPANPGWQAFSQERFVYARDHWGYDGLWLDNLDLDLGRATNDPKNADGDVKEYSDNDVWRDAMRGWLVALRGKLGSWPVWANLVGGGLSADSWDVYAPYLDGAMDESYSVRWLDGWRTPADWEAQTERAERWLASGKGLVMVGQGARDNNQQLLFTLSSYMLVANSNASFRYTRFDSYYNALWLYPEYDTARALGAPLGSRQEVSSGVWRRQFTNGYVEVDVEGHTGRLVLNK